MPLAETLLHFSAPAVLVIGALAAAFCMCAALLQRPNSPVADMAHPGNARAEASRGQADVDWIAVLNRVMAAAGNRFHLMRQVPLERLLEPITPQTANPIGPHKIDCVILDDQDHPVLAARFSEQPRGRHRIKTMLEDAGVPVVDILPGETAEDIADDIFALLLSAGPHHIRA